MVLRRCRRLLGDEDRALDAMQEVFVRVIRSSRSLRPEYPSSLLYRIATNVCLNMIRDDARRRKAADEDLMTRIAHAGSDGARFELSEALDRLFRRHAPSTREIAVMRYLDGMSLEEVARECGLSVSGVRRRLRRLRDDAVVLLGKDSAEGEA